MSTKPYPARLHVLLATEAPVGLVIRRGPSRMVCTLRWYLDTDEFVLGQWFKGRIFEHWCDLSPNGKYFLHASSNDKYGGLGPVTWTAVSEAPFLNARLFFDTRGNLGRGGVFISNKKVWFDGSPDRRDRRVVFSPDCDLKLASLLFGPGSGVSTVYSYRLERDGWDYAPPQEITGDRGNRSYIKSLPCGHTLYRISHLGACGMKGKSICWDEHAMLNEKTKEWTRYPTWEWADWDRNRLVFAEKGCLYAADLNELGIQNVRELHNFNDMTFEERIAPY